MNGSMDSPNTECLQHCSNCDRSMQTRSKIKTSTDTLKQSSLLTELSDVGAVVVSEHLITKYCISNLHMFNTAE